jgi:hypothetical protein
LVGLLVKRRILLLVLVLVVDLVLDLRILGMWRRDLLVKHLAFAWGTVFVDLFRLRRVIII